MFNPENEPREQEVPPQENQTFNIGGKQVGVGDNVYVIRSDGTIEKDWALRSSRKGFKIVVDKVVELDEIDPQTRKKKMERLIRTFDTPEEFIRTQTILEAREQSLKRKGYNRPLTPDRMKNLAQDLGIDTSRTDWEKEYQKKIREMSGQ